VLAWLILPLTAVAGFRVTGPVQATTRIAISSSTTATISSITAGTGGSAAASAGGNRARLAADSTTARPSQTAPSKAALARRAAAPARRATWTVRPGDTLSAIATALGVPGGWPALYAANRHAVGPNPNTIQPGTVLALPGAGNPPRYTVAPGDTLAGIAAALGVPGGWQALYAANRHAVGPNPNTIQPGTTLATPRQAAQPGKAAKGRAAPARPRQVTPPQAEPAQAPPGQAPPGPTPPAQARQRHLTAPAPAGGGMPRWLLDVLIAVGVLAATAFAAEPAAALARRRRSAGPTARVARPSRRGKRVGPGRLARRAADKARIILADHERLIVTYSIRDHTVYVLTPPGEDPQAVLAAARLVLPEDTYQDLAGHLGIPSSWPLE
jgi:LysM repeat protein